MKDADAACPLALLAFTRRAQGQIECFFNPVKSAGHQLEAWRQESALAVAKHLLVVSMACVTVWETAADLCPVGTLARKPPNSGCS
ncbi:MAG: hypothetical protein PHH59_15690 [Methylovulum sp.]|nr:hypothetical protein [Methylovulum sp.]MDD2725448.1 hypothetical protein [Methylovulum sp.]